MAVLESNKTYLISAYKEPNIKAIFLKEEKGFYVFLFEGGLFPIRKQYLQIIKEIKNE